MTKKQSKYYIYFIAGTLAMVLIALIVYLPGLAKLIRIDGNYFTKLVNTYEGVSPLTGDLLNSTSDILGIDPKPYYLWGIVLRVLSGLLLWISIFLIWPTERTAAFSSGLYFILFPGFLQQTSAIEFFPHQVSIFLFSLSLCLMVAAFKIKSKLLKVLLILISAALTVFELLLMECFIGLEAMRILFIIFYYYMHTPDKMGRMFPNSFKSYLPWLTSLVVFLLVRNLLLPAAGIANDVTVKTIIPLAANNDASFLSVILESIRNFGKSIFGAWLVTVHTLVDNISVANFWPIVLRSSICAVIYYIIVQIYWNLNGPVLDEEYQYARNPRQLLWQAQWLILAAVSILFIVFPFVLGGYNIKLNSVMDWISYPAGLASSMFIAGMMFQLRVRNFEWCMMVCMVGLGSTAQIASISL